MIFSAGLTILLPTIFVSGTISFLAGSFKLRAFLLFAGAFFVLRKWKKISPITVMLACGVIELIFQSIK